MRVVDAITPGIDLDELAAAGTPQVPYAGSLPSQDWFDGARARGLDPPWMIFETIGQRSQYGFGAGVQDCLFAEARAASRGHTGPIAYVLSDGNYADAWDTAEYRAGIASVATLPHGIWYGSLGVGANWGPETWGTFEFATQLVYEKSPFISAGHDLNEVHADIPPPPPPPPIQEDSMLIRRAEADPAVPDQPVGHTELVSAWGYDWEPSYDALPGATPVSNAVWNSVHARVDDAVAKLKAAATGGAEPVPCPPLDISSVATHDLAAELAARV